VVGACSGAGAALTALPACTAAAGTSINVPSGCTPTVDGVYHSAEWTDAACVTVGTAGDPIYVKYAGTTLYLAWSMTPVCGCAADLVFNQDTATTLDGHQISLGIFDDPAANGGDSFESTSQGGMWTALQAIASGIVIGNPAADGTDVETYEIAIPFSQLGVTAGQPESVGFGASHSTSGVWPAGLSTDSGTGQPSNPADWGKLSSSANWE
jgi:hypothetical protein